MFYKILLYYFNYYDEDNCGDKWNCIYNIILYGDEQYIIDEDN